MYVVGNSTISLCRFAKGFCGSSLFSGYHQIIVFSIKWAIGYIYETRSDIAYPAWGTYPTWGACSIFRYVNWWLPEHRRVVMSGDAGPFFPTNE
jgi:hypothetical protein